MAYISAVFQSYSSYLLYGIPLSPWYYSHMKKLTLSAAVIAAFVLYSYHSRHDGTPVTLTLPNRATSSGVAAAPAPGATNQTPSSSQSSGVFKDGSYTGSVANAYYGNIQVRAVIQNGKLTDVTFLQYPNDRSNSIAINQQAMPLLTQEAVQSQTSQVDIISGATDTSEAFVQSLGDALAAAKS